MSHIVTTQALPSDTKLIRRYFALSNKEPTPITRYFTQFDPVANAYYELATPITLTGDFETYYSATSTAAMNFTDTLGVNSSGVIQSDNATDVEVNGVSVGLGAMLPLDGKLNHIKFIGLTAVDITVFWRSGTATNYFDGIPSDVKITDTSGAEDVTPTFAINSGKGVSVENSLEGNNSLTRINVDDEDIGLYTKTDDGWLGDKELVTNGGFDTDTDWSKGTGWTISGGTAQIDGTQTTYSTILQGGVLTEGYTYKSSVDVIEIDGTFQTLIGSADIDAETTLPKTLVGIGIADGGTPNTLQNRVRYAGDTAKIDNVSVKHLIQVAEQA